MFPLLSGLPARLPGANRGDGIWSSGCRRYRRERPSGDRIVSFGHVAEASGGRDNQPGEDPGTREGGHADRCEGRPFLRDAAEGNSGQGDSLLSLEAEEQAMPDSDDDNDNDAEGPTATKRIKKDEAKFELKNARENSWNAKSIQRTGTCERDIDI